MSLPHYLTVMPVCVMALGAEGPGGNVTALATRLVAAAAQSATAGGQLVPLRHAVSDIVGGLMTAYMDSVGGLVSAWRRRVRERLGFVQVSLHGGQEAAIDRALGGLLREE